MSISKYFRTYYYQLQNIKRLDFKPAKNKVIVSLTTVPSRIRWLKPTIISLLRQKPDVIEINLARTPLKKDIAWKIPAWLTDLNAVRIFWLENDYGPASKFIPTIERHAKDDCQIIVVDDDMIYPQDLLSRLLHPHGACEIPMVFCTSGHKIRRHLDSSDFPWSERHIIKPERVAIIEGCGGYILRPEYLNLEQLKGIVTLSGNSVKQDDVWISGLLAKNNVPKYRIPVVGTRRGTINAMTPSITGIRTQPFNEVLRYFAQDWPDDEYVD